MWVHKISATQLPVFTSSRTLPSAAASREGKQWGAAWANAFPMIQNIRKWKDVTRNGHVLADFMCRTAYDTPATWSCCCKPNGRLDVVLFFYSWFPQTDVSRFTEPEGFHFIGLIPAGANWIIVTVITVCEKPRKLFILKLHQWRPSWQQTACWRHVTGAGGHTQEDNRTLSEGQQIKGQSGVRHSLFCSHYFDTCFSRANRDTKCCGVNSGVDSSKRQQAGSNNRIGFDNSKAIKEKKNQDEEEINHQRTISDTFPQMSSKVPFTYPALWATSLYSLARVVEAGRLRVSFSVTVFALVVSWIMHSTLGSSAALWIWKYNMCKINIWVSTRNGFV